MCVRLSRLLVGFRTHFKSLHFHSFIHVHDNANKAYAMLGIIQINFKYVSISGFIILYKIMVRSQLDYCSSCGCLMHI